MAKKIKPVGTDQEVNQFSEVFRHYTLAKEDLDARLKDFDKVDELFRSHIEENNWPYQSLMFDPITFTAIFEKTSRLFANKPRGRLVPREGGDALGAKISNEVLSFQWDDNERVDAMPMLAKWAQMDMNARKYGASFALCKWHYECKTRKGKKEVFFDGPNFKPLVNRDCLPNPAYSSVKNWFQYRDYLTIQELETVNDAAQTKPVYKNLDILMDKIRKEKKGGDLRSTNYLSKNLSVKNKTDFMGRDEVFKTIEVVTEYRADRWITFAPRYGVIIRDIESPYDHGQIPIVMLKYYPVDDDIYGLSEIEPIEKLQKGANALLSQYIDAVNVSTYPIIKVKSTGVQMHTLEFKNGAKWLMNDPINDVVPFSQLPAGIAEFPITYRILRSAANEGLGESSEGVSNASPGQGDKTATEVVDSASQRNARDNFNQIFLAEALKKQMLFWQKMNQQFFFTDKKDKAKVIRIVGKEAIRYFEQYGLSGKSVSDEAFDMLSSPEFEGMNINPESLATDSFPVDLGDGTMAPKFQLQPGGDVGELLVEPGDLSGSYDFIPDIESMALPNEAEILGIKKQMLEMALNPATSQLLAVDGYKFKFKELFEDFAEQTGVKDADKYFEKLPEQGGMNAGIDPTGGIAAQGVSAGIGVDPAQGMGGGNPAASGVQGPQLMGRPSQIQ